MGQPVTIRLNTKLLKFIEKIRDPQEFPTLSDFVRRAVEQYAREIRRRQIEAECRSLAGEDLSSLAEADISDYVDHIAQAERGEL